MAGGWLERLRAAIKADGRSMRAVSQSAGLGANYLSEVLNKGKEPGVEKLAKVCEALNVSLTYIITGVQLDRESEEYLLTLSELPASERQSLIDLSRALRKNGRP
jgi:transcriptional regulator with XRE-family HTH domain